MLLLLLVSLSVNIFYTIHHAWNFLNHHPSLFLFFPLCLFCVSQLNVTFRNNFLLFLCWSWLRANKKCFNYGSLPANFGIIFYDKKTRWICSYIGFKPFIIGAFCFSLQVFTLYSGYAMYVLYYHNIICFSSFPNVTDIIAVKLYLATFWVFSMWLNIDPVSYYVTWLNL